MWIYNSEMWLYITPKCKCEYIKPKCEFIAPKCEYITPKCKYITPKCENITPNLLEMFELELIVSSVMKIWHCLTPCVKTWAFSWIYILVLHTQPPPPSYKPPY